MFYNFLSILHNSKSYTYLIENFGKNFKNEAF